MRLESIIRVQLVRPSLLKHSHLQPTVQTAFEYLKGWRHHNLSGQPAPVLGHPHNKKVFSGVQREATVFQYVPIVSCPVPGHHWKKPDSVLFAPSLQVFMHIDKVPGEPALPQAEQSQLLVWQSGDSSLLWYKTGLTG